MYCYSNLVDGKEMKHSDFIIGECFYTAAGKWKCTDKGTRTVIAIKLDLDESWHNGPPYLVAEYVFDENDLDGCRLNERI